MPGLKKVPGSIASDGFATLGVTKPTREKIRQLAKKANLPISDYIKALAEKADERQPVSAIERVAIIEQLVSHNERLQAENERLQAENEALQASYSKAERLISHIYHALGGRKPINTGIRRTIRAMIGKAGLKVEAK